MLIGNSELMRTYTLPRSVQEESETYQRERHDAALDRYRRQLAGVIAVSDTVKPTDRCDSAAACEGLRVMMLTGDNEHAAQAIARKVGVDEVVAGVLPPGKVEAIRRLQEERRMVAMVGDGMNDAPALAQADMGLTMASGSDIAMEAGDVTLMRSDLTGVAGAISLSRGTMRVMRQNLFWAFPYNVIGIPLAAGVLFPVFGLTLSPVVASAAMALSSFSVVTNSLRLRRLRLLWERYGYQKE